MKISQTRARQKMRNRAHDPHVALSIVDPDDPDGRSSTSCPTRYLGTHPYPHLPGDERVVVYIRPTDGSAMAA